MSAIGADVNGESAYARSKGEGERAVREVFPDAAILRPSAIFGPEDKFFNQFAALAALRPRPSPSRRRSHEIAAGIRG